MNKKFRNWVILWVILSCLGYVYMVFKGVPVWMQTNQAGGALIAGTLALVLFYIVYEMIWKRALEPMFSSKY